MNCLQPSFFILCAWVIAEKNRIDNGCGNSYTGKQEEPKRLPYFSFWIGNCLYLRWPVVVGKKKVPSEEVCSSLLMILETVQDG
jgi:hypothetical protein